MGAQGMLGAEIFHASLERDDIEIIPYARFNADIRNEEAVMEAVQKFDIDGVINTAAYTNVDKCEDERWSDDAWEINAKAPEYIASACREKDIPFYHFSTDYVFSGETNQAFSEDASVNPINAYGAMKAEGEKAVLAYDKGYVLRTAWLSGEYGQSFVNKIVHFSKTLPSIKLITNEWGSPSFCEDVTASLFDLILSDVPPAGNIFHLVNEGNASREELVAEIQDFLEMKTEIVPVKTFGLPAPRPVSSILKNTKLPPLPSWQDGLHRLLAVEKRKLDEKRIVKNKKEKAKEKYRAQQEVLKKEKEEAALDQQRIEAEDIA